MSDQEELYRYNFECCNCFLNWHVDSDHEIVREDMCDYCKNHENMTRKERLLRRIEILHYTSASRFPEIIRDFVKHIELKDIPWERAND